jgi:hypothetical protein
VARKSVRAVLRVYMTAKTFVTYMRQYKRLPKKKPQAAAIAPRGADARGRERDGPAQGEAVAQAGHVEASLH